MPRVRIVHETEYTYVQPVQPTQHRLLLYPRGSRDLHVRSATLDVTPTPSWTGWAHDVSGNVACCLRWDATLTQSLRFAFALDVDHHPAMSGLPLDPAAETYPFSYQAADHLDLAPFLRRHYPDPDNLVEAWARRFLAGQGPTRTMHVLAGMAHAIREGFRYEMRDEEGVHPPAVTLHRRAGACRDFAVLMMEAARALGLAARFVCGYLYSDAVAVPLQGGGATHAWCAIYLPGAGWMEFDPTNGLAAGRNLVRVCTARTPEQAVPISGAYLGRPEDFGSLRVQVEAVVVGGSVTAAA